MPPQLVYQQLALPVFVMQGFEGFQVLNHPMNSVVVPVEEPQHLAI
jgi:hypothetical protein